MDYVEQVHHVLSLYEEDRASLELDRKERSLGMPRHLRTLGHEAECEANRRLAKERAAWLAAR